MDTAQRGPLMMLGGGILMAIGTLLDWRSFLGSGTSGLSFDSMGFFGIITLVLAIVIGGVGAVKAFGLGLSLPDELMGLSLPQALMIDAFAVFLWTFAWIAADFTGGGVHLTWIGAAVAMVGAALADRTVPAGEDAS